MRWLGVAYIRLSEGFVPPNRSKQTNAKAVSSGVVKSFERINGFITMDIRTDLMKHFGAGMLIAVIIGIIAYCTNGNWLNILLTSALCGVVANLAKDYSDKAHGCVWDWSDVGAGTLGAIFGASIVALSAIVI